MSAYRHVKESKFMHCVIREKGEVYKALRTFFGKKDKRKPYSVTKRIESKVKSMPLCRKDRAAFTLEK